jgi:hypothetical protein
MATQTLSPTTTFIITMTDKKELPLDHIATIFKFTEQQDGFYEILILAAETEDVRTKLTWLAMQIHAASHPHVRTRMIRYPSQSSLTDLLETTMNLATGQRILVTTNAPEIREKIMKMTDKNILITNSPEDPDTIRKDLTRITPYISHKPD